MEKIKLQDVFDITHVMVDSYGIFSFLAERDLSDNPLFPLVEDFINHNNSYELDSDYHVNFSAEKYLSPFAIKTLNQILLQEGYTFEELKNDEIPYADKNTIINEWVRDSDYAIIYAIYNRFAVKWKKIYDALVNSQYDPLHNYDMEEKRTPNTTRTETFNSVTDTRTPNLTTSGSANATTGVFGFNGTSAKDSATNDGTSSESVTGTDTNVKTGNIATTETGTDTTTRKGNIGVTTSQQLIESELELRKHDFYAMIYKDIDSILCLKIY